MTGSQQSAGDTASASAAHPHPRDEPESAMFPVELANLDVGEDAGLIEFEHRSGYGRIAIERTADGESDIIKLQRPDKDAENGYRDLDVITTVGRWFSRGAAWDDLLPDTNNGASGD